MKAVIDWSKKPAPWCYLGPAFKAEVEAIAAGNPIQPFCAARWHKRDPSGRELARRRLAAGLTQRALADKAGLSASVIANLETGRTSMSALAWARIDAALAGTDE